MTILSLNTWLGFDHHPALFIPRQETADQARRRRAATVEFLRRHDPDLVFLQEVCPLPKAARELAQALEASAVHQIATGGIKLFGFGVPPGIREGLVILARHGLSLHEPVSRQLSGPRLTLLKDSLCFQLAQTRWILGARVSGLDHPLYVFTLHTHSGPPADEGWRLVLSRLAGHMGLEAQFEKLRHALDWGQRRRHQEFERAFRLVEEVAGPDPALVAGDLNVEPCDPDFTALLKKFGLRDLLQAESGPSWEPLSNPLARRSTLHALFSRKRPDPLDELTALYDHCPRRVDYILLRDPAGRFAPGSGAILPSVGPAGEWLSDHSALLARL
jgi:endonuclease/exonuclease/phosphatase family metal-dependent hydrolase